MKPSFLTFKTQIRLSMHTATKCGSSRSVVWDKVWVKSGVVGGRTFPKGGLHVNSHNALGRCANLRP